MLEITTQIYKLSAFTHIPKLNNINSFFSALTNILDQLGGKGNELIYKLGEYFFSLSIIGT